MITCKLKQRIDALWQEFWTGGITNPLTVIEQITYLMFARLLDIHETRDENRQLRSGRTFKKRYVAMQQHLRWSQFRNLGGENMLPLVRDEVFPHLRRASASGASSAEFMKDAQLMIQKASLLVKAVEMVHQLPLTEGDTKGDLYEYLLGKLTTAGINGQFRTPRHIIRLMVDMLEPEPDDVVCDPACGTGGFLVSVMENLYRNHTSPEGILEETDPETGEIVKLYSGDLLEKFRPHIQTEMFHGFDFDATMLRIATMNLMLHGVDDPKINYQDTLSSGFTERYPEESSEKFDKIWANPPFKGSLDFEDVHANLLRKVKTKKTELLFLTLILRMLKTGGRSATIVPDGVLFGSSHAHLSLRKLLMEENQLEAVISLPSGVFKPYAGVSTGVLIFTKGGRTDNVFFYDVQNDGFSLDDKRNEIEGEDLSDCLKRWQNKDALKETDRTSKAFYVPVEEIKENNYDLSLNRYKEIVYEEENYDPPQEILGKMINLEKEITRDMEDLRGML